MTRLLIPGIGSGARAQHATVDPVAVVGDVGLVQQGEQLVLGDARFERPFHQRHAVFGDGNRVVERHHLEIGFTASSELDRRFRVEDVEADVGKRCPVGVVRSIPIESRES